jgi:hypothetical protein
MNFLRIDVICMRNVLKYHSAKDPGKVDSPFEVRFDMNASRKRKNTKPKGFFEKLKEQRNQRKADRAKQTDRKTDMEWDCYITACHFTAGSLFLSDGVLFAQSICSGTSVGTVF